MASIIALLKRLGDEKTHSNLSDEQLKLIIKQAQAELDRRHEEWLSRIRRAS